MNAFSHFRKIGTVLCAVLCLIAFRSKAQHSEDKPHTYSSHAHSQQAFSDKEAVAKMAQKFESAERDSMQQPEKVLRYMGPLHGKKIMDIGAGTGYFSVKFAGAGASVIAADVSEEFQEYLQDRIAREDLKHIALRKIPYDNPLLKEAEVDIVFMANTYHHIADRVDYFSKVKKGLKEGGELVVVDFFKVSFPEKIQAPPLEMRISADEVIAELKKAGFTHFEVEVNLLPYQYIIKAK